MTFEQIEKKIAYQSHDYGVLSNCRYLLSAMRRYRKSLIPMLVIVAIAGASMGYIWSFIGKLVIDMIEQQSASAEKDILPLLWLVIGTSVVTLIMTGTNTYVNGRLNVGYMYIRLMLVRERIAKIMEMDYEMLEDPVMLDRHHLASRATGGGWNGVQGLMMYMGSSLTNLVSFLTALTIISTLNLWLVLIMLVLSGVEFLYFEKIRKLDKKIMWDAMAGHWRKLEYFQRIASDFSYAKDIRIYGMKDFLMGRCHDVNNIELAHWAASRGLWQKNSIYAHSVSFVRQAIVYGWLIFSVASGAITIGEFTLYSASAFQFANAVSQLLKSLSAIRERSAQTNDFRDFMDAKIHLCEQEKTVPIPKAKEYTFEFRNVSFRYRSQEKFALKNINFTFRAGERLAVVGLNGAGKTTFIKLLLRLYDATEGAIYMNGIDIRDFDRAEYFKLFAPAFQEAEMFALPMDENVSMSEPAKSDYDRAEKMLRAAGLGEKIDSLPRGTKTEILKVLYDDGINLSGGERQKLALARALYKEAPVVVLDEPTAALDALAEYRLYQNFDQMIGKKSAVYISHRLSSTRFCDRVAMFKDGELVETGTHEELIGKDGAYAEMFRVQAQYYVEEGKEAVTHA
ncbi:MAG: ABC transporter ATP-binding protein/permease [Bacteroides sp.]|nr:ABC transporter ATP-binding protein/permease [Eubacterium sp.]MCM1417465.1 ABC transporter ATP-binding protein/permease [Roseburia sp.]MCM1461645.1 ABC transporter ATP-binding protein/permease [Bacteroides sp.]